MFINNSSECPSNAVTYKVTYSYDDTYIIYLYIIIIIIIIFIRRKLYIYISCELLNSLYYCFL